MLVDVPGDEYDLEYEVVVVGGGSAGCAFAARCGRRVLMLEAGSTDHAPQVLDAGSLAAADAGHPANWAYPAELRAGHAATVPRGRVLGGSSAINGAN